MSTDQSNTKHVRFSDAELRLINKIIDSENPVSPQLKRLIFKGIEAAETNKKDSELATATMILEATIRDRMDQMVSIIKLMADRIEELEKSQQAVAADAARSKLVIENVQDHVADFLNSLPAR